MNKEDFTLLRVDKKDGHEDYWYETSKAANEYLTLCPNCYFGRVKTCKYCGKPLPKQTNRCNCDEYRKQEAEEKRIKYQETINKAKEIELKDMSY